MEDRGTVIAGSAVNDRPGSASAALLSDMRRASLLAYCKLAEFGDDPEVLALLEAFYSAAVGYMEQAGISPPPEGTARRAQYDLCVNYLTLDSWDRRDMSCTGTAVSDNPAFRRMVTQLKLTEAAVVSKPDTTEEG